MKLERRSESIVMYAAVVCTKLCASLDYGSTLLVRKSYHTNFANGGNHRFF